MFGWRRPRAGARTDLSDDDGKGGRHVDKTGYTNCHDDGYKFQVLTHVDTQKTTELLNSPFPKRWRRDWAWARRRRRTSFFVERFKILLCVFISLFLFFFLFTEFLKNSVYNLNLERWRRKEKKLELQLAGGIVIVLVDFWLTMLTERGIKKRLDCWVRLLSQHSFQLHTYIKVYNSTMNHLTNNSNNSSERTNHLDGFPFLVVAFSLGSPFNLLRSF